MRMVLGLEIHLHLKTEKKMFCYCSADIFGATPNTHTCPVCLGLPGALPVPNADAVKKTQLLGLSLNSTLNTDSRFDRKHYHYPDLPKGYQISQYLQPLCVGGYLELDNGERVNIERIHLEEDVAKSIHKGNKTLLDFNKSGIPLVEIVTKPEFESVENAVAFSKKIQEIVRASGIGDADMEKGQMRLEANISLKPDGDDRLPGYKVEIKNINSFKFLEKAVTAEIKRQEEIFAKGEVPVQENRGYDEDKDITVAQREKEFAHDYRYFPEPDIPPMVFTDEYIEGLNKDRPSMPDEVIVGLVDKYKIDTKTAKALAGTKYNLELFEKVAVTDRLSAKRAANLIINKKEFRNLGVEEFLEKAKGQELLSDESEIEKIAKDVLSENADAVENFKNGKQSSMQFLIGQVMRKSGGKADPAVTAEILKKLMEVS